MENINGYSCFTERGAMHKRQLAENHPDHFDFCQNCHVLLSTDVPTNQTKHYYRPSKFAFADFFNIDPNKYLDQLILKQKINRAYNNARTNLEWRPAIILWIKTASKLFSSSDGIFHLSVSIFDAILFETEINTKHLRLVAFMAIYLSLKSLEKNEKIPTWKYIASSFGKELTEQEFFKFETDCVQILEWKINLKTPFNFLCFFLGKGILSSTDFPKNTESSYIFTLTDRVAKISFQLIEASFVDYSFNKYSALEIASAAIAISRKICGFSAWNNDLTKLTRINIMNSRECVENLWKVREVVFNNSSETTGTLIKEDDLEAQGFETHDILDETRYTVSQTPTTRTPTSQAPIDQTEDTLLIDHFQMENSGLMLCKSKSENSKRCKKPKISKTQLSDKKSRQYLTKKKVHKLSKGNESLKTRTEISPNNLRISVEIAEEKLTDISSPKSKTKQTINDLFKNVRF